MKTESCEIQMIEMDPENASYSLYYRCAIDMMIKEHDRWYSWTYIFLIIISTIIYTSFNNGFESVLNLQNYVFYAACALFSFLWLIVILNLSASSSAWHHTIKDDLEKNKCLHIGLITNQRIRFNKFSRWVAFWSALGFIRDHNNSNDRDKTSDNIKEYCEILSLKSVTSILLVLSLLLTLILSSITVYLLIKDNKYILSPPIKTLFIASPSIIFFAIGFLLKTFDCKNHFKHNHDYENELPECCYGKFCNFFFRISQEEYLESGRDY